MKIRFAKGTNTNGESIKLPVIPPNFSEKCTDNTEYYTTINGSVHSISKPASAMSLSFESYFPFAPDDPLATGDSWREPMDYVNFFLSAEKDLIPVKLTLTEEIGRDLTSSGKYTKGSYFSVERMYIPHLTWTYKAKSFDIWYTLELKEYIPASNMYTTATVRSPATKRSTSGGGFVIGDIVIASGTCKKYLTESKIEELYFGNNKVKFSNDRCKIIGKNKSSQCIQSTDGSKRGWTDNSTSLKLEE